MAHKDEKVFLHGLLIGF